MSHQKSSDRCLQLCLASWYTDNSIIKKKEVKKRIKIEKIIESKNSNDDDYYIAVDIGKKNCVVCITDKDGSILEETKYENTLEEAKRFASNLGKKYINRKCQVVCESTANMWLKTYEAFDKHGIDVKLANPMKTKAIAEAKIKTDKLDARTLAHLLRSNLIAESYIAPDKVREDRSLLRLRINLVSDRTRVMNRVHSLLDKHDLTCNYGHIFGLKGIQWLKNIELKGNDQVQLANYIHNIEFLNSEIIQIEKQISNEASTNEDVKILMSMTGIDCFSAMLISSEIGDISRFRTAGKLVSWCGLCPTVHQSGNSLYMGRMKKDGNKKINWIMIQAANTASRTDERMKKYYLKIAKRHGHHVAITHVANKMIRITWSMLTYKQLYNERKKELYETKLKRIQK
jgi:transposase